MSILNIIILSISWKKSDFLKMQYSGKFILKDSMKVYNKHHKIIETYDAFRMET